jgi:hypothetical protein
MRWIPGLDPLTLVVTRIFLGLEMSVYLLLVLLSLREFVFDAI